MKKMPLLLLILFLIISCSARDTDSKNGNEQTEKGVYPDLIMTNTSCRVGQSSSSPIVLMAGKMTLYSEENCALLEDFSFVSYAEDGSIETEGKADGGTIELDGSSISLDGNVTFSRPGDNMTITAESLIYDKKRDEITTKGRVMVISDEGTVTGYDFRGDLIEGVYSFSRITEGDFTLE